MPELRHMFLSFSLCLPRMMAMFVVIPFFGRGVLPGLIRTGVIASLALIIYPIVEATVNMAELTPLLIFGVLIKEVFIGGMMGFVVGILFWGVEAAGFFIDNHRGAAIAGSVDPLSGSETSPFGIFFLQAYTVYFFVSGGFLLMLGGVYESFAIWPVLSFFPQLPPDALDYFLSLADKVMYFTVLFAGPVVIAMFLSELGLALISRFAPQLNVFILSMPVKSGVALFILVLYFPFLFSYLGGTLEELRSVFALLGYRIE